MSGLDNHGDLLRMIHAASEYYQDLWFERGESTSVSGRTRHVLANRGIQAYDLIQEVMLMPEQTQGWECQWHSIDRNKGTTLGTAG